MNEEAEEIAGCCPTSPVLVALGTRCRRFSFKFCLVVVGSTYAGTHLMVRLLSTPNCMERPISKI